MLILGPYTILGRKRISSLAQQICAVVLVAVFYMGCSSLHPTRINPSNTRTNRGVCYYVATTTADSLPPGMDIVVAEARVHLRECLEPQLQEIIHQFAQEVDRDIHEKTICRLNQLSQEALDRAVFNSALSRREILEKNGKYRTTIELQVPFFEVMDELMDRIWSDTWLLNSLRSSILFRRYEKNVQAYKSWKRSRTSLAE